MEKVRNLNQLIELLRHNYTLDQIRNNRKALQIATIKPAKDEQHFCLSLAGRTVSVDSLYLEVYHLCKGYESFLPPEICISINESDIVKERGENELSYNDSYLETLTLLRKISEAMLAYDTFLMHGAVIAIKNQAYMFTAESGVGKTTHVRKWLENAEGSYIVNGDKPLIRIKDSEVIACGTPWCGKEKMGTNSMVPLKAIVFLERCEENSIREISFGQAMIPLMKQVYEPTDAEKMRKTISLLSQLKGKVRFFHYCCNNMKSDAFDVTYKALMNI